MKLLPHWVITNRTPGFYDTDSGTTIEQTAKVYRAMNELIEEFNTFVDTWNTKIEEFNSGVISDNEAFRVALRQEFQDFINVVELKIEALDQYAKNEIGKEIEKLYQDLKETGEFTELFQNELEVVKNSITELKTALETDIETLEGDFSSFTSSFQNHITAFTEFCESVHTASEEFNRVLQEHAVSIEGLNETTEEHTDSLNIIMGTEPVNALSLGMKNDGSEDISSIYNANNTKNIYFPPGKYRVDSTLNVIRSIYGAGSQIHCIPDADGRHTSFISKITDNSTVIKSTGTGVIIKGINIKCNANEKGITDEGYGTTSIEDVTVYNINDAIGIYINRTGSRGCYLNNISCFSNTSSLCISTGIRIAKGADHRLNNISIMGCQMGLRCDTGGFYGSNFHIWTSKPTDIITESWWKPTTGLYLVNSLVTVDNLYIDTARMHIGGQNSLINISNYQYWNDSSVDALTSKDCMIKGGTYDSLDIRINGGCVLSDDITWYMFRYLNKNNVKNVMVLMDPVDDLTKRSLFQYPSTGFGFDGHYVVDNSSLEGTYKEVARIGKYGTGVQEITFRTPTLKSTMKFKADFTSISKSGDLPLYYRVTGTWMIIYSTESNVQADVESSVGSGFVNYDFLRQVDKSPFPRLSTSDLSTLKTV